MIEKRKIKIGVVIILFFFLFKKQKGFYVRIALKKQDRVYKKEPGYNGPTQIESIKASPFLF
jgi:hypothetical protein